MTTIDISITCNIRAVPLIDHGNGKYGCMFSRIIRCDGLQHEITSEAFAPSPLRERAGVMGETRVLRLIYFTSHPNLLPLKGRRNLWDSDAATIL